MLHRLFPGLYEGWIVVASSAFIIAITMATFVTGFGTIFNPILNEFGWSVAATSLAFSLRSEIGGIAAPIVGVLLDRFGSRPVLLIGLVIAAAGIFLMSFIQNIWQFYGAMMVVAAGHSAASGISGYKATATWFERRRGRAMAFVSVGGGLSGLFVVVIGALVDAIGWRGALRIMAVLVLAIGVVPSIQIRERPRQHHQPIDGAIHSVGSAAAPDTPRWGIPVRQVVVSRPFLLLAAAFAVVGFASAAFQVHQIPFAESRGISTSLASTTVAIYGLATIVGRLGSGFLADKYDKLKVMAGAMALGAAALPVLVFTDDLWQIAAAYMVIAVGFGALVPVRQAVIAEYFGTRYFGTINGVSAVAMTVGGLFGPLWIGVAVDATDAYSAGWVVTGALLAASIPVLLAVGPARPGADPRSRSAVSPADPAAPGAST